jgi:hypothetical protein
MSYRDNVLSKIIELPDLWKPKYTYRESLPGYKAIPYGKEMMIEGYFQSVKYFENHLEEVIDLFTDKETIEYLKRRYDFKDSVSIHVRRGDYCGVSTCRPLPVSYYNISLSAIDSNFKVKNIYVFSDDMDWCRDNFEDKRMVYVMGQEDFLDFYMMSLCPYNIIANSTFSAWASILNKNKEIVIAPEQWSKELGTEDIYCKDWIVL